MCGPEAVRGQVGSASPDALDSTIVTPNRSRSSGRIALSGRGPGGRPMDFGGRAAGRDRVAAGEVGGGHSTSHRAATATSVVRSDHHSSHWFIRGVTPRCRIRRWVIRQSARLY